jgi:hypothetical protein
MNQRIKKLWVKALRSGDFLQGKGCLGRNGTYCCLGVLETLAVQEHVTERFDGERGYLSPRVVEWAGTEESNPKVGNDYLAWLNDQGLNFSQIANRIEKYL